MYHELFDEALREYNAKQKRADRRIGNYYDKIRSGKQEKPFHELIIQIGNRDDTSAQSEFGARAAEMLDEYMKGFQERNPHLRVFAAHLHMDEATPHLHIDFIPFTTGSKRGLSTRVSLKSALAQQGITGGTKQETEWNLFVRREKQELAAIMERHGVGWLQRGTHEKHLSVLDYEKKMRAQEVDALTAQVTSLEASKRELEDEIADTEEQQKALAEELSDLRSMADEAEAETSVYRNDPEWQLPDPKPLMSAGAYRDKIVIPFVEKLKKVILMLVTKLQDLMRDYKCKLHELQTEHSYSQRLERRNERLQHDADDLRVIREELGDKTVDDILDAAYSRYEEQQLAEDDTADGDWNQSMQ